MLKKEHKMSIVKVAGLKENDGLVFPILPAGTYKCRITDVEPRETGPNSKNPGSPMLRIGTKVSAGEEQEGHVQSFFVLLPTPEMDSESRQRTISRIKRICIAAGLDVEEDSFDTDDLMGAELRLVVTVEEREGTKRNNIVDQLSV